MQDYKKLLVWQKAHELALLTYRLTADFPRDEVFGLRHSLRKTSVDIPALIAEGCGKSNNTELAKSTSAALGYTNRLEYYGLMSHDLAMLTVPNYQTWSEKVVEVRKMLSGFNNRIGTQ